MFGAKILAKPKQFEMLEEQLKMLTAKSESLDGELQKVRSMIGKVAVEDYLHGLEGVASAKSHHEMREEEMNAEISKIQVSESLTKIVDELKAGTDDLLRTLKSEVEMIRQFTADFPEIFVIENESQKKDRLRRSQNTRKVPPGIVKKKHGLYL